MHVLTLTVDLHLNEARSLKMKRSVVKSIVEGARRRFVANSQHHATDVIDEVERFVWSHPEVEVLNTERRWLE